MVVMGPRFCRASTISVVVLAALASTACATQTPVATVSTSTVAELDSAQAAVTTASTAVNEGTTSDPQVAPAPLVAELTGSFTALDGTSVDLASLQGTDVVLWFWAPW